MPWRRSDLRRRSCSSSKSRLRSSACAHCETTVWSQRCSPSLSVRAVRKRSCNAPPVPLPVCSGSATQPTWPSDVSTPEKEASSSGVIAHTGFPVAIAREYGTSESSEYPRQAASSASEWPLFATSSTARSSGLESTMNPASAPTALSACSTQVELTSAAVAACESAAVIACSRRVSSALVAASASARRRSTCSSAKPAWSAKRPRSAIVESSGSETTRSHETMRTSSASPPIAIGTRRDEWIPSRRVRSRPAPRASSWTSGTKEIWSSSTAPSRDGKSARSPTSPAGRCSECGSEATSSSRWSRSRQSTAKSEPNVRRASLQIAAVALSGESVWKRGATRRIRSSPSRDSRSRAYSIARSSACPPRCAARAAIASASSCGDACSSKRRLSAPTTSRPDETGTATAPCAYRVSAAPSEKSRSKVSRSATRTIVPVRAACAIGARVVSGNRRPGACVCVPTPWGSTTTTASPSMRPSAPPRAPTSFGVRSINACATSEGVTAADRAAARSCIPAISRIDASAVSAAMAARLPPRRMTSVTHTMPSATARLTPQRVNASESASGNPAIGLTTVTNASAQETAIAANAGPGPPTMTTTGTIPTSGAYNGPSAMSSSSTKMAQAPSANRSATL